MNKKLLLILIKNPLLGKAKTRLAATVGPERALEIYQALLNRTHQITSDLPMHKALYYSDFVGVNDIWDLNHFEKKIQTGNDLGDRMYNAFKDGFERGYGPVCIIGSDCYELTQEIINQAFAILKSQDVVLGPSTDGGYYLLGMNILQPAFFKNKDWSTPAVLNQTLSDAQHLGLTVGLLPTLTDVDEEKDLVTMRQLQN